MTWRLAMLSVSALGRGAARRESARRTRYHRRAEVDEALAQNFAAHTLHGIETDFGDACRADLGDAARRLESLAELTTPLRSLDSASRERLQADLDALERALAEKLDDVRRGLEEAGPDVPEAA